MGDEGDRVSKYWWREVPRLSWWGRVGVGLVNAAIHMERVKVVMVRAADKAGEQFSINSWNTDYEVFLSKDRIKVLDGHNVQVHGESERSGRNKRKMEIIISYLGNGQDRIWEGLRWGSAASWGQGPNPVTTANIWNNQVSKLILLTICLYFKSTHC